MIFVARQLQEKCREKHHDLYMAFVDLTKVFDSQIIGLILINMIYIYHNIFILIWFHIENSNAAIPSTRRFSTPVSRDLLWNILRKLGSPPTFITILQQFHIGMCAQVVMAGSQSSSIPVDLGVKQGCILASIIFNLLLVVITLVSHRETNHQIALKLSIVLMVVSSTCDVSRPKLRLLLQ